MTGLSFANPWMLAGLAAVGLPILVHLLTRARPRQIAFPPFRFLAEACAGQQAVHRLRTIILLTIRTLAILALVVLFARPFLKPGGGAAGSEAGRRVVIVLDASLSMRAVQQGVPLFARAQAEAAEILRALDSGSEAAVVLVGSTPRALLPALSRNLPALHDELVKTGPTWECGDPAAALAMAQRLLGGAGTICVLSDFQRSNWQAVKALPGGVVCRLRPTTTTPIDNIALTGVRLTPADPVVGEPVEVLCTVFNGTAQPRQENVRLELGDFAGDKRVEVPPFGTVDAAFSLTFPRSAVFSGRASLPPDDLREDNVRHLAVQVHPALQILVISDTDLADARSAAFFIGRALVPSTQAAPGYAVVRRHSQDADRGILESAGAFVLVSPALLSGEAVETIARRVNDGARLLVFLDGATAPGLMPGTFSPPFRVVRSVTSEFGDSLVPGRRELFADAEAADWAPLRFRRHWQTELFDSHQDDVLLGYPDGSVALATAAVGKGAAAFANLPVTPDGSDLAGSPMFPAMLQELLHLLRQGDTEQAVTPGNAWTIDAPTRGETPLVVVGPDQRPVAVQVVASGRIVRLALPAAQVPGVYLVRQGEQLIGAGVANVDPRESDTRPVAIESLKPGDGGVASVIRNEEELALAGQARPLWPQLAATAALLLAAEMVLLGLWRRQPVAVPGGQLRTFD